MESEGITAEEAEEEQEKMYSILLKFYGVFK